MSRGVSKVVKLNIRKERKREKEEKKAGYGRGEVKIMSKKKIGPFARSF